MLSLCSSSLDSVESLPEKLGSTDRENATCELSVQKGQRRGGVKSINRRMYCVASVLQENIRESVTGGMDSSDSDLFAQPGFVQILQEATVYV